MAHSSDPHVPLHPLLLPEILNVLGPFLQTKSLLSSILVCKTWHRALESHLWHTVHVAQKSLFQLRIPALTLMPNCKSYSPEALLRNLPHIRAIHFSHIDSQDHPSASSDLERLLLQCRNLTMLESHVLSNEIITLLEANRNTIQSIVYRSNRYYAWQRKPTTRRLWDILGSMTQLRHLNLQYVTVEGGRGENLSQGEAFTKVCDKLETMNLNDCRLGNWPSFEQGQGRFSKMKELLLTSMVDETFVQLQMISQCPVLESLTWIPRSSFPTQDFVLYLSLARPTSCLKKLNLGGYVLPDADSAAVIAQLPASCNDLTFDGSVFGALSVAALAADPQRDLSLTFSHATPSSLTHSLLSCCPHLQYLQRYCLLFAPDLLAAPWVASRLVKLNLTLSCVADLPPELGHSAIYKQLSRLVSLEDLCLDEVTRPAQSDMDIEISYQAKNCARRVRRKIEVLEESGYGNWLDFSLENGMGELASLGRLRRLDLGALRVLRIRKPEALWIATHWPALTSLFVRGLHHDSEQQREVLKYLGQRRPELKVTVRPEDYTDGIF